MGERLIKVVRFRLNATVHISLKHYIAAALNSYDAMLLAIRSTSERDIDEKDQGNLTASFIAAAYGNDQSLAALVDWGANIHFERSQPLYNEILPHKDLLNVSRYIFQWGYNLATQILLRRMVM